MTILALGLAVLAVAMSAAANILHIIAPRTKNTVDDRLEAIADKLAETLKALAAGDKS